MKRNTFLVSMGSIILFTFLMAGIAIAQVPEQINYQGYLADSEGSPVDGTVSLIFSLYDVETGGTPLWTETQDSVTVTDGIVNVLLGSVTSITLDFSQNYWLEITVNSETLSPRTPLVSVGYAFRAEHTNNINDADADPTNELNTDLTLNGTTLALTDASGTLSQDLSSLQDGVNDADADPTNELNTSLTLNDTMLELTDAGGTLSVAVKADPPCFDNGNRYVDCANGTVTDTVTGLIWLKNANCFGYQSYADANNAAAGLQHGECGLTDNSLPGDWRLPTIAEWGATIARADALGCTFPNLTNTPGTGCYETGPQPFTGIESYYNFWSSTTHETEPFSAWYMPLATGGSGVGVKSNTRYVWPIRGGE